MAATEGFGFTITADDASAKAFASVLKGARKFASTLSKTITAPLAGLSKIQLPIFAGIQNAKSLAAGVSALGQWADEGLRAQIVMREFASRLSISESRAYSAARAIQEAANGAVSLDQAMELTNRSIAQGFSVQQVAKFFQFASVRAKSIGVEMTQVFEQMVDSLVGGEAGEGAIKLGLLSKADRGKSRDEIMQLAMSRIDQDLAKVGISGKEAAFQWDRLNSAIDDIADGLKDVVVQSDLFARITDRARTMAEGFRDFMGQNAAGIKEVFGSVANSLASSFSRLFGGMGSLFSGFSLKGIMETATNLGFTFSKALLSVRIGFEEVKKAAFGLVQTVSLQFGKLAESKAGKWLGFDESDIDAAVDLWLEMQQAREKSGKNLHKLREQMKGLNLEQEEAVSKIRAMKDEGLKVGAVFDGWRSKVGNAFRSMGTTLSSGFGNISKIAGEVMKKQGQVMAASIKDAFNDAKSKVDEARKKLEEAQGKYRDFQDEKARRDFEITKADIARRLPGSAGERQINTLELGRAQSLFRAAQAPGVDSERKVSLLGEARDLAMSLRTDPLMNNQNREMLDRLLVQFDASESLTHKGGIASAEAGVSDATAKLAQADIAAKGREAAEAMGTLKAVMNELGRVARDTSRQIATLGQSATSGSGTAGQIMGAGANLALQTGLKMLTGGI